MKTKKCTMLTLTLSIALLLVLMPTTVKSSPPNNEYILHTIAGMGQTYTNIISPQAVHFVGLHNRTYFVYLSYNWTINIFYYDHDLCKFSDIIPITSSILKDEHVSPSLLIDDQGYLHVFYGSHASDQYYIRSLEPENITAWTDPKIIASGTYTYPISIFKDGRIIVILRGATNYRQSYVYSDDGGNTWSTPKVFIDMGSGICYRTDAFLDANGYIHIVWTWFDPSDNTRKNVYYAYSPDGCATWYSANNTNLGDLINKTEADNYCLVYNSSGDAKWIYYDNWYLQAQALAITSSNSIPVILYERTLTPTGVLQYRIALWNTTTSSWIHYDLVKTWKNAWNIVPWGAGTVEVKNNTIYAYFPANDTLIQASAPLSNLSNWNIATLLSNIPVRYVQLVEDYLDDAKLFITYGNRTVVSHPVSGDGYYTLYGFRIGVVGTLPRADLLKWSYVREIVIKERSNTNLTNYAVRIELNSTNFDSWDKLNDDGSDLLFTLNKSVLPHFIDYFDKTEKKAVIWVRLPYIPANDNITIEMHYGNPSAIPTSNPHDVFLFYEDFERYSLGGIKGALWSGANISHPNGAYIITYRGSKMLNLTSYGDSIISSIGIPLPYPIYNLSISFHLVRPSTSQHYRFYVSVKNYTGGWYWYFITWIHDDGNYFLQYYDGTAYVNSTPPIQILTDKVYVMDYRTIKNKYVRVFINGSAYELGFVYPDAVTRFTTLDSERSVPCFSYVDDVRIRAFADPEPVAVVGSESARPIIYLLDRIGNNLTKPLPCKVLNGTTGTPIFSGTVARINLPFRTGLYLVKVYYAGILIKNITITVPALPYTTSISLPFESFIDYRSLEKGIACSIPQTLKLVENLSTKFPYSRVKVLINGTGDFTLIYFLNQTPTSINIISNVSVIYSIKDSYLYINGTLSSTAEIIIEDQFLLSIFLKDRLGYKLANFPVYINGTKYTSDSSGYVRAYLVPELSLIHI